MKIWNGGARVAAIAGTGLAALLLLTTVAFGQAEEAYARGIDAIDDGAWREAVHQFDEVIAADGPRVDAALYWKAYALEKAGRVPDALNALQALRGEYPGSRWRRDAAALEDEIRRKSGRAERDEPRRDRDDRDVDEDHDLDDDDLEAVALQSLLHGDPERAMPILLRVLEADGSQDLKEQALFVLIQHGTPEAYEVTARIARDDSDPEMQEQAIHHLGAFGGERAVAMLEEIFADTDSAEAKEQILHAWMVAGAKPQIVGALSSERDAEVREGAVQMLGIMGAIDELDAVYASEASEEVKEQILHAYMVAGARSKVLDAARNETSDELRENAVHLLGVMGARAELEELYRIERSDEVRSEILQAFMICGAREPVLEAARDLSASSDVRADAVHLLGVMGAQDELHALYADASAELKEEILQALFISGDSDFLARVARDDLDPEVRGAAIHSLGLVGGGTAELLAELYQTERSADVRAAILQAFFIQGNTQALIRIARTETDRELKLEAVQHLSHMGSRDASEFMMELLEDRDDE